MRGAGRTAAGVCSTVVLIMLVVMITPTGGTTYEEMKTTALELQQKLAGIEEELNLNNDLFDWFAQNFERLDALMSKVAPDGLGGECSTSPPDYSWNMPLGSNPPSPATPDSLPPGSNPSLPATPNSLQPGSNPSLPANPDSLPPGSNPSPPATPDSLPPGRHPPPPAIPGSLPPGSSPSPPATPDSLPPVSSPSPPATPDSLPPSRHPPPPATPGSLPPGSSPSPPATPDSLPPSRHPPPPGTTNQQLPDTNIATTTVKDMPTDCLSALASEPVNKLTAAQLHLCQGHVTCPTGDGYHVLEGHNITTGERGMNRFCSTISCAPNGQMTDFAAPPKKSCCNSPWNYTSDGDCLLVSGEKLNWCQGRDYCFKQGGQMFSAGSTQQLKRVATFLSNLNEQAAVFGVAARRLKVTDSQISWMWLGVYRGVEKSQWTGGTEPTKSGEWCALLLKNTGLLTGYKCEEVRSIICSASAGQCF